MKTTERVKLTAALREQVARIAGDLRAQMLAEGPAQARARRLHADEQVGEDFAVWSDLLSRRAAVLFVLKSVYVRVLEDRGLLSPGRILDPEAQQLFEKLAPNLGETAFLRWVYRDLASVRGGLPELFAAQPAEVAEPADELSRALLGFWRHKDPDSGACWRFGEERFEGELMGDLYQDLDPVVKGRFALCQTPDFVRGFILDRTLTPAIAEYGADQVRLLDPACGSGHFLIDGLKRLVAATEAQHKDWDRREVVTSCLSRVVGVDLNDYACALARARLVMTAAELTGATTLGTAAAFRPQVYWADGLEQVEKGKDTAGQQLELLDGGKKEAPRASLTRPEVRAALGKVLEPGFQAVVANPPYITEKDARRKEYHREKVGKGQRYVSAYREYSLGSPFLERCFQLAVAGGYVGLITGNNFMKREFGKPLIEKVLAGKDLTLVVDTSQAYIPHHGTPTVLLFGRSRPPEGKSVRAVMGKRGETGAPEDPAKGRVWCSIVEGWERPGFENEFVSVMDVPRATLAKHPWSLGGSSAGALKESIEVACKLVLGQVAPDIGRTTVCGEDEVYIVSLDAAERLHVAELSRPLVIGEVVRDWSIQPREQVIYPYESLGGPAILNTHPAIDNYFWRFRSRLKNRTVFGKSPEDRGGVWYEHLEHYRHRFSTPLSIAFAFVATHNHFVLDRGGKVFKQSAPVIKLLAGATEDDHLALLGLLNSSTACFWMKQVFHPKGTATRDTMVPENNRYEFAATGLQSFPIPAHHDDPRLTELTRDLDRLAAERQQQRPAAILSATDRWADYKSLSQTLVQAAETEARLLRRMAYLQEEIDWLVYELFGLADKLALPPVSEAEIDPGDRPFLWETAAPPSHLPTPLRAVYAARRQAIEDSPQLRCIENRVMKRPWRGSSGESGRYGESYEEQLGVAAREWLAQRLEDVARERGKPFTLEAMAAAVQDDVSLLAVASVVRGRQDVDLRGLVSEVLDAESVPSHPYHIYTESGLKKRAAWEETWRLQREEDAGKDVGEIPVPPEYSQGSRGKPTDFLKNESWKLRGALDVPRERFIAFTEVPTGPTRYGWAGWAPSQRIKAILVMDEDLEDAGVPLADRIALLDSAWRLLPDVARQDPQGAGRLKAELQALVGPEGPSRQMLEDWRSRFPPPGSRRPGAKVSG